MGREANRKPTGASRAGLFGSLRDALTAAARDDGSGGPISLPPQQGKSGPGLSPAGTAETFQLPPPSTGEAMAPEPPAGNATAGQNNDSLAASGSSGVRTGIAPTEVREALADRGRPPPLSAAEAARSARGENNQPENQVLTGTVGEQKLEKPPTTRVVKEPVVEEVKGQTAVLRGKQKVDRGKFERDPVVGWLVIVGGPGMGCFRPVYEGNNTIGRAETQRISLDFGDDAISSEEQAYLRYDSIDRAFLFVPNLSKTNVVSVNDKRPTAPVELRHMDVITIGRTQLVFVPFCGTDFDWSELADAKR